MQLNKDKFTWLNQVIDDWKQSGLIDEQKAGELKATFSLKKMNWKAFVMYAFIISIICAVMSVIILLADKPLRAFIEKFTQITDAGISALLTVVTCLGFYIYNKKQTQTGDSASNTTFLLFVCFLSLASVGYWAKTFAVFQSHYPGVFLIAAVMFFFIAVYFQSQTVWVLMISMLLFAYGLFTFKTQDAEGFWQHANFPLRYWILSIFVLPLYGLLGKWQTTAFAVKTQYVIGLILFFTALWLCSIFGNNASLDRWTSIRQFYFIPYAIALFICSLLGMLWGLKKQDTVLSGISLSFFILNLITRYFEYLWKPLHKSVFFLILALLFWFVGTRVERYLNRK